MIHARPLLPSSRTPLPEPEQGWFDVTYSVSFDGRLSALRATDDVRTKLKWRHQRIAELASGPMEEVSAVLEVPLFAPGTLARIHPFDGGTGPQFELTSPLPRFDRLPGQRWLVSGIVDRVLESDGTVAAEFDLGNHSHLQADATGRIWVGYHDEGIFGHGAQTPVGAPGIVRFTQAGEIDWAYSPPTGNGPWIADCYALNVSARDAWSCFYTDFPVLHVDAMDGLRLWENEIAGAECIAVHGDHVALLGGYSDSRRLVLLSLGANSATIAGQFDLAVADNAAFVTARGDTFHVVGDGVWHRLSVADIPH